jgi:hypothetical protein
VAPTDVLRDGGRRAVGKDEIVRTHILALGAFVAVGGCSDDDDRARPWCGDPPPGVDPATYWLPPCASALEEEESPPEPYLESNDQMLEPAAEDWEPIPGLVAQPVWWSAIRVDLMGGRVARLPEATRIDLEIDLENYDSHEVDYQTRNTWDLVLANGERLNPYGALGVLIAPGDRTRATLSYQTAPIVSLVGAQLELNGFERRALEPERLPLDEPIELVHSYTVNDLEGVRLVSDEPGGDDTEILDARWGANSPLGFRSAPDERLLTLHLRITARLHWFWVQEKNFRVAFDGAGRAPEEHDCPSTIDVDTSAECTLLFTTPLTAKTAAFDFTFDGDGGRRRVDFSLDDLTPRDAP